MTDPMLPLSVHLAPERSPVKPPLKAPGALAPPEIGQHARRSEKRISDRRNAI